MRQLVLDNGQEFHRSSLEQVCLSLGITMQFSPRRTPWAKGKIERFFGTMNRDIAHGNPGTTFSNIFDKDDYDPAKHTVITLSILQNIVRKWIADVYHQEIHRSLQTTPATLWNSSIRFKDIRLPDNTTELDAIMGTSHKRDLTHKGIEFESLLYNSTELSEWRQIEGNKIDVEIRVDQSDLGSIRVLFPKTSTIIRVPCLTDSYANGISLWQHRVFKRRARTAFMELNATGWLQAKRDIQSMVEQDMLSKHKRSRKRAARFLQDSKQGSRDRHEAVPASELSFSHSSGPGEVNPNTSHFGPAKIQHDESHLVSDSDDDESGFEPIYRRDYTRE